MKRLLPAVLFVLLAVATASAQSKPTVIDGSQHPEQISDVRAYSVILTHYSNLLADSKLSSEAKAQLLRKVGLPAADDAALREVLADHKARKDAALKSFANGGNFALADTQVLGVTLTNLKASLSAEGLKALQTFVQNEKRSITVVAGN